MAMETHNRVVYEGEPTTHEERAERREELRREEPRSTLRREEPRTTLRREEREAYHREEEPLGAKASKAAGSGSALVAVASAGVIVLALLGLFDIVPLYMAAIGIIVAGAAFLIEGGSVMSWALAARERYSGPGRFSDDGISAEVVGGIAGIILGILALVGVAPLLMLPVAVLTLGASVFLASWGGGTTGAKLLIGIGTIVLGVLGLMGYMPLTLTLVALLALGFSTFFSGSLFAGKFFSAARA